MVWKPYSKCPLSVDSPTPYQPTHSLLCPQRTIYPLVAGITIADHFLPQFTWPIIPSATLFCKWQFRFEPTLPASSFHLLQKIPPFPWLWNMPPTMFLKSGGKKREAKLLMEKYLSITQWKMRNQKNSFYKVFFYVFSLNQVHKF